MKPTTTADRKLADGAKPVTALEITVLAGGPSAEREVSLQSGEMVGKALSSLGHHVHVMDVNPEDLSALDIPADVVFIALHGSFGEDGAVQRLLESRGLAYTGSGPDASALAMDKVNAKARFIECGIPTPRFDLVHENGIQRALRSFCLPAVVKPRDSGSSVDTFIVRDRESMESAITHVVKSHGAALVEEFVDGPEWTVGMLGDAALPICEIRTKREFYDYQAKYIDDDTEYVFDIDWPSEVVARVKDLSADAHRCLGCRDFSRVDWMIDRATGEPYIIEVNTIPGFTSHSLLPKAARRAGWSYESLCQTIVEFALQRGGARS